MLTAIARVRRAIKHVHIFFHLHQEIDMVGGSTLYIQLVPREMGEARKLQLPGFQPTSYEALNALLGQGHRVLRVIPSTDGVLMVLSAAPHLILPVGG